MQLTLQDRPLSLSETLEARFKENGINARMLSFAIKESQSYISDLMNGKISLSSSMALKLSVFFETTPDYWYRVEYKYNLYKQRNDKVFVDQNSVKIFAAMLNNEIIQKLLDEKIEIPYYQEVA